jgi:hypothetical protein
LPPGQFQRQNTQLSPHESASMSALPELSVDGQLYEQAVVVVTKCRRCVNSGRVSGRSGAELHASMCGHRTSSVGGERQCKESEGESH